MDGVWVSECGLNHIKALAVKFTDRRGRGSMRGRGRGRGREFMGRTTSTDTNDDDKDEEKSEWCLFCKHGDYNLEQFLSLAGNFIRSSIWLRKLDTW